MWRSFSCDQKKANDSTAYHFHHNSLHEYDFVYLKALLEDDLVVIAKKEEVAKRNGYGPLLPCTFTIEHRAVRQFCGEYLLLVFASTHLICFLDRSLAPQR
jgi:hypothetical protein